MWSCVGLQSLAALTGMTLLTFVLCDGPAAKGNAAHQFKVTDHFENDIKVLEKLVDTVKKRISFGKDVAIYKWVNGEPILDKVREQAVMNSVAKMAKDMNKPFGEDERQFFVDLMEATKLIEYTLVSDWFTKNPGKSLNTKVSLVKTRKKISAMQAEIINAILELQRLKHSEYCQEALAKSVSKINTKRSIILRVALQRAFGNFCKTLKGHNDVKF